MDIGQVETEKLGWVAWLRGERARNKIVREADIEAAMQSLPATATVLKVDPNGHYVVYEMPNGDQRIRFRASEAWLPNEPTASANDSLETSASITAAGHVLVIEGLHRTRDVARERVMIGRKLGGVKQAPGWLDFVHDPDRAVLSPSSIDRHGTWTPVPAK